jgi:hypothetical protein
MGIGLSLQGKIQFRNGTAADWTAANPTLLVGEMGVETDTGKFKIGDGATAWNSRAYGGLVGPAVTVDSVPTSGHTTQALSSDGAFTALAAKAPLASPVFTGNPTAPTPTFGDADTSLATTGFVQAAITALINSSPAALDTLQELAAALGNDANFATSVTNSLATKFDKSNGILTGVGGAVYAAGRLVYDTDNDCPTFFNSNNQIALQIGQEEWTRVRNVSGATIPNGSVVYVNGANSGLPTIALAKADALGTANVRGIATHDIANNSNGFVTRGGVVNGLNTNAYAAGTLLYLSATTAGAMTDVAPVYPNYRVSVGTVTVQSATVGAVDSRPSAAGQFASTTQAGLMNPVDKAKLDNESVGYVNVLDYAGGVVINTGVNSCEAAFTAAAAALGASGGVIRAPRGTYLTTSTPYVISGDQIIIDGDGPGQTTFKTASTTGDQIRMTGYGSGMRNCSLQGPGSGTTSNKTAGIGLDIQGTEGFAENVQTAYQFDSIRLGGALVDARTVICRYFTRSGVVVDHQSDHRITTVLMVNNAATLPTLAGIEVKQTASLVLEQLNIIASNFALNLNPATGVTIPSIKATDCFFDTSAVGVNMTADGSVLRSEFTNCWFSSQSIAGIRMDPSTNGQVDGVTFVNCDIYNNVGGTTNGVIAGTRVKKWKMVGCSVAGWTNGINLTAGANHFPTILSNTIGSVSAFGVNGTGIVVAAGSYKGLVISGNDVVDNTTAISLGAVTPAAGANYRIIDNAGINPRGTVTTPAVGATTVAVTNTTGFRVTAFIKNGTTAPTAAVLNGVTITAFAIPAASGFWSVQLDPGATIAFTYTVVPTWVWVAN